MTLFLCGFMGCGKTALSEALSNKLNIPTIDMDEYIVNKMNMTIPEIFAEYGEEYFRNLEKEAVIELRNKNGIIACGGGTMQNDENSKNAKETGEIIFINQTFETCYDRIKDDTNRPLVVNNSKKQLEEIYNKRSGIYKKNSTIEIIPGDTPQETADIVIENLKRKGVI
jgi:shikimate kinase